MKAKKGIFWAGVLFLALVLSIGMSTESEAKKKKKKSLSKAKITLSKTKYTYNGKAKKPKVTVKLGKKKLKKNKDYTVKYTKNKKAGTAKVTIKAKKGKKKKYKGSKKKTFKILKASRKVVPGKTSYSAVEGDGAFNITAKASKGGGTITYSCATSDVIDVTKAGKVSVVKVFDRTCRTLSSASKESIKKATAEVTIKLAATSCYKAASKKVKVTIHKKASRTVNAANSIRNFDYDTLHSSPSDPERGNYACDVKLLKDMNWTLKDYIVPGLGTTGDDDWINSYVHCNNLCPQGICVAGDYLLTSAYCMDDLHDSCIVIYDLATGERLNTLVLKDQKSHVGGIAYDTKNEILWICHSKKDKETGLYSLQKVKYSELKKYATGTKKYVLSEDAQVQKIPTKPSSIAYNKSDGYLWVAQFCSKVTDGEDDEESLSTQDTNMPYMYAYEYKNGQLQQVREQTTDNTAVQDYFGVTAEDKTDDSGSGTSVVVKNVYEIEEESVKDVFQVGDVISAIGDEAITTSEQLEEILERYSQGDIISVTLCRWIDNEDGTPVLTRLEPVEITLGARGEPVYCVMPTYVQGVTFTDEGNPIFSCSYGRNSTKKVFLSELWVCKKNESGGMEENYIVKLPPMVEEVEMVDGKVYMLFESAAMTYLEGTDGSGKSDNPIDKIVSLQLEP